MAIVVLALAVAITAYVGWLMWNAPESPPLPPGASVLDPVLNPLRNAFARARQQRPST